MTSTQNGSVKDIIVCLHSCHFSGKGSYTALAKQRLLASPRSIQERGEMTSRVSQNGLAGEKYDQKAGNRVRHWPGNPLHI
jgi:hypothetical protein